MTVSSSQRFKKMFKKHPVWVQKKFYDRISLFSINPFHPLLNNHSLGGEWRGYKSINITGDIRVIFKHRTQNEVDLIAIGTHSELYS